MWDDTIPEPSPEGLPQEAPKGRRLGVVLCTVSAIVTSAVVVLIAGRLFVASEAEMWAKDTEELREISPAAGTIPKN